MAILAMTGGIVVFIIKLVAFLVSDSIALLSDALESIINIVASGMLFASIRIAERPADKEHQFGHRKAENISCLIEGILVLMAAVFIIYASIGRLFNPVTLRDLDLALLVSLFATAINGTLSYVLARESRRTGSIALEGDSKHLLSDVLSSLGVIVGLAIASFTGLFFLDSVLAFLVGALIIKMGYELINRSCGDLLDMHCPSVEEKIREILDRTDGHIEFHELKTRKSGDMVFVTFHLCVNGGMSVYESHEITERIESELKKSFPDLELTIHVETEHQSCLHKKGLDPVE